HRRQLLTGAAALAGAAALSPSRLLAQARNVPAATPAGSPPDPEAARYAAWTRPPHPEPGQPGKHYRPTTPLNGTALPWTLVDGVKVINPPAEEVWHEFVPKGNGHDGLKAQCWGYNGQVHGPTIECVEGDRLRFYVTNKLPAATTIHWHGIILPNGMDGVGGLTQKAIPPGQTYMYEFPVWQHGTFMYHSHHDEMTHMALGLIGM